MKKVSLINKFRQVKLFLDNKNKIHMMMVTVAKDNDFIWKMLFWNFFTCMCSHNTEENFYVRVPNCAMAEICVSYKKIEKIAFLLPLTQTFFFLSPLFSCFFVFSVQI